MIRKILTILSLIGLLMTVGLWVRSFWFVDFVTIPITGAANLSFSSGLGELCVGKHTDSGRVGRGSFGLGSTDAAEYRQLVEHAVPIMVQSPRYLEFSTHSPEAIRWGRRILSFPGRRRDVSFLVLPHWYLLILLGAVPLTFGCGEYCRHRKRKKLGLCVKCGYDLRGSKDRCPECGQKFETQ